MNRNQKIISALFVLMGILLCFSCEFVSDRKMEIIPIEISNKTYSEDSTWLGRIEYFLVENYIKNDLTDDILDDFTCNKIAYYDSLNYGYYHGYFYKESWRVTKKKIGKDEDFLDVNGVNIYSYMWENRSNNKSSITRYISMGDSSVRERTTVQCDFGFD
jgi:hypothetical protein